jgi:hypothetical protein
MSDKPHQNSGWHEEGILERTRRQSLSKWLFLRLLRH